MGRQPGIRLLTAYAWSIAVTGLLWVAFTHSPGVAKLSRALLPSDAESSFILKYTRSVSIAFLAIGGALLAHSPLATKESPLLDSLSRRFDAVPVEQRVRPLHGALLLARLCAIVPCSTVFGLLWDAKSSDIHLLVSTLGLLVAVTLSAMLIGAGSIWIRIRQLGKPLLTYVCVWLVPELLRLVDPRFPTCRLLLLGFLKTATTCWGGR